MKKRHSVEQIIRVLGEIEHSGLKISDACRPHGISEQTYYRWRSKYGGMEISEARRLKELEAARSSDLVIATIGLWGGVEEHEGMDRTSIEIPAAQTEWLKRLRAVNPNIVCVVQVGSSLAMTWVDENIPAILNYWYPGQQGGHALADVLFGDYNPAGRLPLTFYASDDQLFPMYYYELYVDITRGGRTYLYQKDKPLYPFGHGLSYTTFDYSNLKLSADKLTDKDTLAVSVDVKNTGPVARR